MDVHKTRNAKRKKKVVRENNDAHIKKQNTSRMKNIKVKQNNM